jgi:hypothetical protein
MFKFGLVLGMAILIMRSSESKLDVIRAGI